MRTNIRRFGLQRNRALAQHPADKEIYPAQPSFGLGVDHLWFLGALMAFGLGVALRPVPPNDFWWHLKIGELIYNTRNIPTTNIFAWSLPAETPFIYGAWMGEYLFYFFYRLGGLHLVIFIRTLTIMLAFIMMGYESWRRCRSWRVAGLILALAGMMSITNLVIRPQIWALIPFISFYILINAYIAREISHRWLLLLPLIMALWVNLHGSFILGYVLLVIFLVGETAQSILKQPNSISKSGLSWIFGVAMLCCLAILFNPRTIHIFSYVHNLMTDAPSQNLVVEWQSPVPDNIAMMLFYLSNLLFIVFFAFSKQRPRITDILLVISFLWLAWNGVRYVIWYALVAMPVLAGILQKMISDKSWIISPPKHILNLVIGIVLIVPMVLVQPWVIERLPMPEYLWKQMFQTTSKGPLLSTNTPLEATRYLRKNTGGKLFNDMVFGSYLIWALPEQRVFIDPRVELFPYEQWIDYIRISTGVNYTELLEKYGANRLLLDVEMQAELITALEGDAGWEREYEDAYAQVWRKVEG
jgi:hypothetical protein